MIEITESLFRRLLDGDPQAIEQAKAMLPEPEPLFNRWATHPEYGRVLCVSVKPNENGYVWTAFPYSDFGHGARVECTHFLNLDFDPLTLATVEDFENAPEGTIVVNDIYTPMEKCPTGNWEGASLWCNGNMADRGPWQVVRWGKGNQAGSLMT